MEKEITAPVAEAVRELRRILGESQEEFAVRMGVTVRTIARWETVRPPKGFDTLTALSHLASKNDRHDLAMTFLHAPNESTFLDFLRGYPDFMHHLLYGSEPVSLNLISPLWEVESMSAKTRALLDKCREEGKGLDEDRTAELLEQSRASGRKVTEIFNRLSRALDDLAPLMEAVEHPDKYADELTAWRIVRREIERKCAESQPKASSES